MNKFKILKKLSLISLLSIGILSSTACNNSPKENKVTIAVIGKGAGGEYWLQVRDGALKKGKELGVDVKYYGPPTEVDVAAQIEIVENVIQRKVDGIALGPTNSNSLSPVVKKAVAAGIKVVTIDSDTVGRDRLSYIGTNNQEAGKIAGEEMKKLINGKGKIAVVTGVVGAQNLEQRNTGFKEGITGDGVTILPAQPDNGDKAKAVAIAENTLTAHSDINAFFTNNAIAGPGVAQALKTANKTGDIKVVAFDVTPALLDLLGENAVQALIAQKPDKMGELGVEMLVKAVKGEKIPDEIDTGVDVITKENMAKFKK